MSGKILPPPEALLRSLSVEDYQKVNKLDLINPCSCEHLRGINKKKQSNLIALGGASGG
jgi:hypothetical protein